MTTRRLERRRQHRTSVRTTVWIGQDGIFASSPVWILDLSEAGAFIEGIPAYAVGAVLSLRFRLPDDGSEVICTAIVRHTRGGRGLGVEFLDLTPETVLHLRQFIGQSIDEYLAEHR